MPSSSLFHLNQVCVADVDYFLYVKTKETSPLFCAIGQVRPDQKTAFLSGLNSIAIPVLSWAHCSIPATEVEIPQWIESKDSEIIKSHYRFWRMLRDHVD